MNSVNLLNNIIPNNEIRKRIKMKKKNSVKTLKEKKNLNKEVREILPGNFIELEDGTVHYQIGGSDEGELIVLVHGFSSPMFIWDPTFNFLVEQGFRVLRYDLFGRGFSDRPKVKYTEELFDRQLHQLIEKLQFNKIGNRFSVIGLSMGGIITVNYADNHPEFVKRLVLVDPAGFPTGKKLIPRIMKIPILNKLIFKYAGSKRLVSKMYDDFLQPERFPQFEISYKEQMEYRGFLRAILSTMLKLDMESAQATYERIGKTDIPVLLIWGELDETIPYHVHQQVCDAIPQIEFHSIQKAKHLPHYEQSDEVNEILLKFLKTN